MTVTTVTLLSLSIALLAGLLLSRLAKKVKQTFTNKTVWLYTGFLWEEVKEAISLEDIDVLVDGEFKKELNDNKLKWIGSSNQRIIDVQNTLKEGKIVLHCVQ